MVCNKSDCVICGNVVGVYNDAAPVVADVDDVEDVDVDDVEDVEEEEKPIRCDQRNCGCVVSAFVSDAFVESDGDDVDVDEAEDEGLI